MNATARFLVERQAADGEDWRPLAHCNSLHYAKMIAATGLRRHLGASYRLVHVRTGKGFVLAPLTRPKPTRGTACGPGGPPHSKAA